ncbi:MAG: orotate phosphoribosyltransferase [Candidatus Omnitrophota bacterium]|nr:orotate phosphoribosyltransferase [Candidatus Omnitrophota bacterium]
MDEAKLRSDLLELVKQKAMMKGDRTLASGKKSDFYIDGKQVTLDAQGIFLTGKIVINMIHGTNADAVGGPIIGADPIVAAVALLSSQSGHPVRAFLVRKEAKDHGMQKQIEGPPLKKGDRVVVVEDVVTTGASVLKAIKEIEKMHAKVVKVICLVDREEGADETLAGYNFSPIFSVRDLKS